MLMHMYVDIGVQGQRAPLWCNHSSELFVQITAQCRQPPLSPSRGPIAEMPQRQAVLTTISIPARTPELPSVYTTEDCYQQASFFRDQQFLHNPIKTSISSLRSVMRLDSFCSKSSRWTNTSHRRLHSHSRVDQSEKHLPPVGTGIAPVSSGLDNTGVLERYQRAHGGHRHESVKLNHFGSMTPEAARTLDIRSANTWLSPWSLHRHNWCSSQLRASGTWRTICWSSISAFSSALATATGRIRVSSSFTSSCKAPKCTRPAKRSSPSVRWMSAWMPL